MGGAHHEEDPDGDVKENNTMDPTRPKEKGKTQKRMAKTSRRRHKNIGNNKLETEMQGKNGVEENNVRSQDTQGSVINQRKEE